MVHPTALPKRKKHIPSDGLKLKSIWDENQLNEAGINTNQKNFRRLWKNLLSNPSGGLDAISWGKLNLPKDTIQKLYSDFNIFTTKIVEKEESKRGDTTKLLIELQDGHRVETVVMRHKGHSTVCISSQIGCKMGCRFCATGTLGIIGDLSAGEILEQLVHANMVTPIRNVVFMGMGEPLNNYMNVKLAVEFMIDNRRFSLAPRHVTVSTVGVVKAMKMMTSDLKSVNLALSLHAPNQEVRKLIVPSASAHPIEKLMNAIDFHIETNKTTSNSGEIEELREIRDGNIDGNDGNDGNDNSNSNGSDSSIDSKTNHNRPLISQDGKFNFKVPTKVASITSARAQKDHLVMIEYILIKDINDKPEHARELVELLCGNNRSKHVLLNLIPYNPTEVAEDFEASLPEAIQTFFSICAAGGVYTRVRQEMGSDISGACGQLALVKGSNNPNPSDSSSSGVDCRKQSSSNNNDKATSGNNNSSSCSSSGDVDCCREIDDKNKSCTTNTCNSSSSSSSSSSSGRDKSKVDIEDTITPTQTKRQQQQQKQSSSSSSSSSGSRWLKSLFITDDDAVDLLAVTGTVLLIGGVTLVGMAFSRHHYLRQS